MLSYSDCPNNLPQMPDHATIDGQPFFPLNDFIAVPEVVPYLNNFRDACLGCAVPTLVAIGLVDALLEVESVLAWNETEKHTDAKWKKIDISYHDAKAVSHLSKGQNESRTDNETGRSHRAHATCRLLMSLAHELKEYK